MNDDVAVAGGTSPSCLVMGSKLACVLCHNNKQKEYTLLHASVLCNSHITRALRLPLAYLLRKCDKPELSGTFCHYSK